MAKLIIIKEPDEVLRKRSKEETEFGPRLHQILDDMAETMHAATGIGIAGAQVGILYRVCLIETEENGIVELVNPIIVKASNVREGDEGCLSVDGRRGMVLRPTQITVRAQDRNGRFITHEFSGRDAVCACHEIDHLDGVLFIDKVKE
jgi:peptide deformylase